MKILESVISEPSGDDRPSCEGLCFNIYQTVAAVNDNMHRTIITVSINIHAFIVINMSLAL